MFSFKASHQNQGFTLIELVVVLFIAGTLAAIAVPSFLSMYEKNQVNTAVSTVQGALKEAQRESMRKSMVCNVTLSSTAITSSNGCLVTSTPTLDKVALASSLSAFRFDIRGNTISNTASTNLATNVTILVSSTSNPKMVKCLVVSAPLGLIRTGKYPFSQVATPAEQYCTP